MLCSSARHALFCLVLPLLSGTAFATDYYVDVVSGSDAASGTSAGTAWKTLTFASLNASSGSTHTLHVAPGTYSSASGEVFPLQFAGQHLVGDAGSAATILDGGGAASIVQFYNSQGLPAPKWLTSMRGFTCRNASRCLYVSWSWAHVRATLEDLVFENGSAAGVAFSTGGVGGSSYRFTVSRCRFVNCFVGLQAAGTVGSNSLTASNCVFQGPSTIGVDLSSGSSLDAHLDHCRVSGSSIAGVRAVATNGALVTSELSDCLVASNMAGCQSSTGFNAFVATTLRRCTIASNTVAGLGVLGGSTGSAFTLNESLVWGNGVDYAGAVPPIKSFSQIGGPNPLFRDPVSGDFRVYFGSPVIDAGDPSTPVDTLDLNGVARSVDGDLDTFERADIGCHEFRTLDVNTTGQQGTLLELEMFGPAGGSTTTWLGRGPFGAPIATPFGEYDLSTIANFQWVTFPVAPGPGFLFQRGIPVAPIFLGQTYSFQGLVTSVASPSGAAWSNAVSFTIVP